MDDTPLDPSTEEFREAAHRLVDWVADYLENVRTLPVLSQNEPGEVTRGIEPPGEGERSYEALIRELDEVIVPGVTHWNHPRFHAYFSVTGSQAGLLGELLSGAFNINGMLWRTSPAATELEEQTLRWVADLLSFPDWFGIICDTASISTFLALAAARERAGSEVRELGLFGASPMTIYCSEQAHSSVDKAAIALGLGLNHVRRIATDEELRMDPAALARAIEQDRTAGFTPVAVVPTFGTTGTAAIDPLEPIIEIARSHDMWVHVDAAYGGAATVLERYRQEAAPIRDADSVVINPHKWLFVQVDCSLLYTRHPDILRRTFSLVPSYLETPEEGVTNFMDYGIQLGRRFRSLKLWMVLAHYGKAKIRERIADHVGYAERLGQIIESAEDLDLLVPVSMSVVVFRRIVRDADGQIDEARSERATQTLIDTINSSGVSYISHTRIGETLAARVAIGNGQTVWSDIEALVALLEKRSPGTS